MTHFGFSGERALPGGLSSLRGASRRSLSEPRRSRSLSRPLWLHPTNPKLANDDTVFLDFRRTLRSQGCPSLIFKLHGMLTTP